MLAYMTKRTREQQSSSTTASPKEEDLTTVGFQEYALVLSFILSETFPRTGASVANLSTGHSMGRNHTK